MFNKYFSYALGGLVGLLAYSSNAFAVGTFVVDTAPAIVDITAAGIAMLAATVVIYAFNRVKGIVK